MSDTFDTSLFFPPSQYPTPPPPELTADQQTKLKSIQEHFDKDDYEPKSSAHGEETKGLSEREIMWLSRETFLRFLTATKGDVTAAIARIEAALVWRRSVQIEDVAKMAEDCSEESRCGKNIVMGFTPTRRPIIYFFPHKNIIPADQRRAVHSIFMLERARDVMPAGVTNAIVVFNFAGKREGPPTSFAVAREVIHILGSHYPETLSLSMFQNVPFLIRTFINLLWPFVDPVTKKKVKFGSAEGKELVTQGDVEAGQLLQECGGDLDLPYDHDKYWPAMVETCLKIRKEQEESFRATGPAKVGREEREWRSSGFAELRNGGSAPAAADGLGITFVPVGEPSEKATADGVPPPLESVGAA